MDRYVLLISLDRKLGAESLKNVCTKWLDCYQEYDFTLEALVPWPGSGGRRFLQTILASTKDSENRENREKWIELTIRNGAAKLESVCLEIFTVATVEENKNEHDISMLVHHLADSLPVTGFTLDVYLFLNTDTTESVAEDILLYGALKRLVTWHSGHIHCITSSPGPFVDTWLPWIDDLCMSVCSKESLSSLPIWRGHLEVLSGRKICLPGLSLTALDTGQQDCELNVSSKHHRKPKEHSGHTDRRHKTTKGVQVMSSVVSNRMVVLSHMHRSDVPLYLSTDKQFVLRVESQSKVAEKTRDVLKHLVNQEGMSLIVRVDYDSHIAVPAKSNFTTEAWKKKVIDEPQDLGCDGEPVKLNNYANFLITCLQNRAGQREYRAVLLRSPEELDGSIMHLLALHKRTVIQQPNTETQAEVCSVLKNLKQFNREDMSLLQQNLKTLQCQVLEAWIASKKEKDSTASVTSMEVAAILDIVKEKYLSIVSSKWKLAKTKVDVKSTIELKDFLSEADCNPTDWPERRLLTYIDCEKKKLNKFKSAESFAGLSPPPREENVNLDIDDLLKCFKPDGSAAQDNLSPIKQTRSAKKLSSITPTKVPWPDVYDTVYHDIYYNKSNSSEKNDHLLCRLRARYVSHETSSTCNSGIGKAVPSVKQLTRVKSVKVKGQRVSSRSRSGRGIPDSELHSTRQQLKRKGEPMMSPPSKRQVLSSKAGTKQVSATEIVKDHRSSVESRSSSARRESRSERHKRQLQDIVDRTLASKGIDKTHEAFPVCSKRLYEHSKQLVKDLPNSYNLKQEMTNIAKDLVDKVVQIQLQRLSALKKKKSA